MKYFLLAICIFSQITFFQIEADAQTLWINAIPTAYHPSFAGSTSQLRISTNTSFQNLDPQILIKNSQWSTTNHLNIDKFIPKIYSGVSGGIGYSHNYHATQFTGNLVIAPKLSFKGKYTFSPSLQYLFGDFRNKLTDSTTAHVTKSSLSAGLMLNTASFFIGVSYVAFVNNIGVITGLTLRRSKTSKFSFTPSLVLYINNYSLSYPLYNQILFLNFKYKKATFGISSWSNLMLGYESDRFRLMLIQSYHTGSFRTSFDEGDGYTAQVSLRFMLGE